MAGHTVPVAETPPAVSVCPPTKPTQSKSSAIKLEVLRNRADFLRAAKAKRAGQPAFLLQARNRDDGDTVIRVGFTCSKKVGNAVARNRAKRRLREIARAVLPSCGLQGFDYVLVGRRDATATRDFALMQADLKNALAKVHG